MPATSQGNPHAFASLLRLRPYVRPYRGQLLVMMGAGLVATLVGIAVPVLTKRVIDGPVAHGDRGALWLIGLYALLFGLAETVLVYLRRWTVVRCSLGLETDIRRDFYRHLQELHVGFHDSWQSGQLVSRVSSDISAVRRFVGFGLVFLVINGMTIGIVGAVLIVIDPLVGSLVIAAGVPLVIAMHHYERLYKRQVRAVQDQVGELATDVEESALGFRTIKAFGRRRHVFGKYDEKAIELYGRQMTLIGTLALLWAVVLGHPFVVLGMVALLGAVAVAHGVLTLGTLVAFVALYMLLAWPIESMGWLLANAQEANSATERVFEVLDARSSIADLPSARDREPAGGVSLVFDRVSFAYPGADAPILRDVELAIAPGETVAVVGPTGCGKTTLTALVSRLYDVSSGAVRVDGTDVRDLPLARLRSIVACAFEDPTLFSVSVRENLTLGRPDAGEDEVAEALRIAQAEFCYDLPWGLDTRVGEQGLTLSGGQRQRLALARAVLGRPPVLVLDDPLSALDVHTEGLVEEALRRVLAGTTGLVVAHRPSTVLLADRVALIGPHPDGGMTITALGRHDDLLADNPEYRDILSQSSDLESELTAGGGR